MGPIEVRILSNDNNAKGDLFGRLMSDLFIALGYEKPRLNVHKSGREVDLMADHRVESRIAIAECKATKSPIGGDDVNKFVGVVDAESANGQSVSGYYISLNGFKETAIEQERQGRITKIILMSGSRVVEELIKGRIIISKDRATEISGRICGQVKDLSMDSQIELVAHARGWIWVIYYLNKGERTHFALVHSDGTPLAETIALEVIEADFDCGGNLLGLICLNPSSRSETEDSEEEAVSAYKNYLISECGYIQLDGMPMDSQIGNRQLKLQNLFIPMHLDIQHNDEKEMAEIERRDIGSALLKYDRLAILGAPGAGKSTLIKRIAISYAYSDRLDNEEEIVDLGNKVPLFIRCRELRDLSRGSFGEIISAISEKGQVKDHATSFVSYIYRKLLSGDVILLIDGLDEISDPGDRAAFVCTIRTTVHAYNNISIIVTSRESGFRHVAAHLSRVCKRSLLSPFDNEDIKRLSICWHKEVMGDIDHIMIGAEMLADSIIQNDRIRSLAENPLLLTTLLLVKRWVGTLPERRALLYGKAVEVLLMTWNVEAHRPIPDDEALPQLCYVASSMMMEGIQKLSKNKLSSLVKESRISLPNELSYVKDSADEFVRRVEDRSSLLMMTGVDIEDGQLVDFFEFRHLTFQEFLTAKAVIMGWYPGYNKEHTIFQFLKKYIAREEWRQVIPLIASLAGKSAEGLIQGITLRASDTYVEVRDKNNSFVIMLGNCLADEAPASPETIKAAIYRIVRMDTDLSLYNFSGLISRGKYGDEFRNESLNYFMCSNVHDRGTETAIVLYIWNKINSMLVNNMQEDLMKWIMDRITSKSIDKSCEGAFGCAGLFYYMTKEGEYISEFSSHDDIRIIGNHLENMIMSNDLHQQISALLALVWLGPCRIWEPASKDRFFIRIHELWLGGSSFDVRRYASWAISSQRVTNEYKSIDLTPSIKNRISRLIKYPKNTFDKDYGNIMLLIMSWYSGANDRSTIFNRAKRLFNEHSFDRTVNHVLEEIIQYDI